LTFNILVDRGVDQPHPWEIRKKNVISLLNFHAPDIFCLQEPKQHQVDYISSQFPDYAFVSMGCRDGLHEGEHMSVFFLTRKFELLDYGRFALSEAPNKMGSVGWDAKSPRLAVWVKLRQQGMTTDFFVMNAHFDHKGEEARRQSAMLLVKKSEEIAGRLPVLICGDFNSNTRSQPYANMITGGFRDTAEASSIASYGPPYTYHKFLLYGDRKEIIGYMNDARVLKVIDHIFYRGTIKVLRHRVLCDDFSGEYPSDHFPKMCDLLISDVGV
jgi:endonuclease/exonuclease/phosphatase family metal-dependent hydrolase